MMKINKALYYINLIILNDILINIYIYIYIYIFICCYCYLYLVDSFHPIQELR